MASETTNAVEQDAIFGPFFAMLLLTFSTWLVMYARRLPFLVGYLEKHKGEVEMDELADPSSRHYITLISPARVRNASDNLKNLFEVPPVFYCFLLYLYVTNQVDAVYLKAAWSFVIGRYLHSLIHCTINNPMRFYSYVLSTSTLWFMMMRAAFYNYYLGGEK